MDERINLNRVNGDTDPTNLQGGPDLDTMRTSEPDIVDEADGRIDKRPQDNPRLEDDRSGAPFPTEPPDPSAEDPFVPGAFEDTDGNDIEEQTSTPIGDGPTYERDQGPNDDSDGGSTDAANTRSHADSGRPRQ